MGAGARRAEHLVLTVTPPEGLVRLMSHQGDLPAFAAALTGVLTLTAPDAGLMLIVYDCVTPGSEGPFLNVTTNVYALGALGAVGVPWRVAVGTV